MDVPLGNALHVGDATAGKSTEDAEGRNTPSLPKPLLDTKLRRFNNDRIVRRDDAFALALSKSLRLPKHAPAERAKCSARNRAKQWDRAFWQRHQRHPTSRSKKLRNRSLLHRLDVTRPSRKVHWLAKELRIPDSLEGGLTFAPEDDLALVRPLSLDLFDLELWSQGSPVATEAGHAKARLDAGLQWSLANLCASRAQLHLTLQSAALNIPGQRRTHLRWLRAKAVGRRQSLDLTTQFLHALILLGSRRLREQLEPTRQAGIRLD